MVLFFLTEEGVTGGDGMSEAVLVLANKAMIGGGWMLPAQSKISAASI